MKALSIFILVIVCVIICHTPAKSEIPRNINYQGYVTDGTGSPLADGLYSIKFTIYGSESGSDELWNSGFQSVQVSGGCFNYLLGSNVPLPTNLFSSDSTRFLAITPGANPEAIPRTKLTSAAYAYLAREADDLSAGASISPTKINGTAAVLNNNNTFTELNYFEKDVIAEGPDFVLRNNLRHRWRIRDNDTSGMHFIQVYDNSNTLLNKTRFELFDDGRVGIGGYDSTCNVFISDSNGTAPDWNSCLKILYKYSGSGITNCLHSNLKFLGTSGDAVSIRGDVETNTGIRVALMGFCQAENFDLETGSSYGVYSEAYSGEISYGIYATAASALTNWAGYFAGNVRVFGTVDDSKRTLRIDHPSDPDNMILEHAGMNSPEMLNFYNGNVITDQNGEAVVALPDYFEDLNTDYRYQLTVIGSFAQAIIKQEVDDNQFVIATSEPETKVSWQVTGIRQDAFALENPVNIETEKKAEEKGYYINPSAFGLDMDRSLEYVNNKLYRESFDKRKGE